MFARLPTCLIAFVGLFVTASAALAENEAVGFGVEVKTDKTFSLSQSDALNTIGFVSDAPLELIAGQVQGFRANFKLDPADLRTIEGKAVADVDMMRTGIELRDEHLRDRDWLHADKHPKLTLIVEKAEGIKRVSDNKVTLTLVGSFTMRGVKKPIKIPAEIMILPESERTRQLAPGNLVRIKAKFTVKLSDYGLEQGKQSEKISDEVEVSVSCIATDEGADETQGS